jgi:integrase
LWQKFTDFQAPQLTHSTIHRDYRKVARVLEKMPDHLSTSVEIRDWLMQRYAVETTRRYIQQFNACCKWAIASDLMASNPFEGVGSFLRRKTSDKNWLAFTAGERDAIIQRFDEQLPFYAPWVKFLFWTGCRPEEAASLQWKHLPPDCSQILIREAVPVDTKKRQPTKNKTSRVFPCNDRLRQFLQTLRPITQDPEQLLFCGLNGGAFEYHNFQTRQWKPTVEKLVEEGRVALYLSQYHCRHTFITLALDHLEVHDIAYLVGNSPTVIYKHYASRSRNITVPEF